MKRSVRPTSTGSAPLPAVINISAYRFAPLDGLKALRAHLTSACREWGVKGTILLSTEGINLFVAGSAAAIDQLLEVLRSTPGLEGLDPKASASRGDKRPEASGLSRVRAMSASVTRSHHMLSTLAAPTTSAVPKAAATSATLIFVLGAMSAPKAKVKRTSAVTRGLVRDTRR